MIIGTGSIFVHWEAAVTYHADRVQKTSWDRSKASRNMMDPRGHSQFLSCNSATQGRPGGKMPDSLMENAMSFEAGTVRACQSA